MTEEQRNAETARDYEKVAMRVSMVSIVANLVLTVFKLLAGVIAHSGAMISDVYDEYECASGMTSKR